MPPPTSRRGFTHASLDRVDRADYLAMKGVGVGIPFYREMKMYVPSVRRFVRQAVGRRHRPDPPDDARAGRARGDVCRLGVAPADGRQFPYRSRRVHARPERVGLARTPDARVPALAVWQVRADLRPLRSDAPDARPGKDRPVEDPDLAAGRLDRAVHARADDRTRCASGGTWDRGGSRCSTPDGSRRKKGSTCCARSATACGDPASTTS